jgi:hypothetical protein
MLNVFAHPGTENSVPGKPHNCGGFFDIENGDENFDILIWMGEIGMGPNRKTGG